MGPYTLYMGRGKRRQTLSAGHPAILPLSGAGGPQRVPASLAASLTDAPSPEPEPQLPTSGEHTFQLEITDTDVELQDGDFYNACIAKALDCHSMEAEVVKVPAEGVDEYLEVVISDNDGDLTVTYICEKK